MKFLIIALLFSEVSAAEPISYAELCKVDPYCKRVVDSQGEVIGVSPAIRKFLEESRDVFIDLGERYQVDPRAAAAAIAAENTMNVQASDSVQKWLAHRGITGIGNKQFSFGLGQINMPAAIEAEEHLAKIDGRPVRSSDEIREKLLTLDGAVYYATGIVRKAQDDYKAVGMDISEKPEILATLYNLGQSEERARATIS